MQVPVSRLIRQSLWDFLISSCTRFGSSVIIKGILNNISNSSPSPPITVRVISPIDGRNALIAAASAGIAFPPWFRLNVSKKVLIAGTFEFSIRVSASLHCDRLHELRAAPNSCSTPCRTSSTAAL
jgi:hypothetical protein